MPIISLKTKKIHIDLKLVNLLVFIILNIFLVSCSKSLSRDEGQKYLRAFDNEFIQLFARINETEASGAIQALSLLPEIPLPLFFVNELDEKTGLQSYNFQKMKGIYTYLPENNVIKKTNQCDSVCILFPFKTNDDSLTRFILTDYSESTTALLMMFPQIYKATITANTRKLADISFKGVVKHELPADAEMKLLFSNFQIQLTMKTSFKKTHGTIKMRIEISEDNKPILSGRIITDVKITEYKTLVYNNKTIELDVFPLKIRFESALDFSSSTSGKFIEEFNNNSNFEIFTHSGDKVGDVFLAHVTGRDRINFHIKYGDGYTENLEDLLLSVKKIINFKIIQLKPLS